MPSRRWARKAAALSGTVMLAFAYGAEARADGGAQLAPTKLDPGGRHESRHQLDPGVKELFDVPMEVGDLLHAVLLEEDVDAILAVLEPDGSRSLEMDLAHSSGGTEEIYWIAKQAGLHRLEVRAASRAAAPGFYSLTVDPVSPASEQDLRHYEAFATSVRGYMLFRRGTRKDLKEAERLFSEALELWRALGDQISIVDSLASLARIALHFRRHEESDDYSRQALDLAAGLEQPSTESVLLNNYATSLQGQGRYEEAVEVFLESVEKAKQSGDRRGEAFGLLNAGSALDRLGRPWEAYAIYEQARPIAEMTIDSRLKVALLIRTGTLAWYSGELQTALSLLEEGLALAHESDHWLEEANLLVNLGRLHLDLGDRAQARELLNRSLEIWVRIGEARGEAEALRGLGRLAYQDGDYPAAEDYLRRTNTICRAVGNLPCEALVLTDLGDLHLAAGRPVEAITTLEASKALWDRLEGGRNEAETLILLGRALRRDERHDRAGEVLRGGLMLSRETRYWSVEVAVLAELGELAFARGELATAGRHFGETLSVLESLRANVASPALRTSLVGSRRGYALRFVDVLHERAERGLDLETTGLRAAESVRARALIDRLLELGFENRSSVSPELLEKEREIRRRITLLDARRFSRGLSSPVSLASALELEEKIDQALKELDQLAAEIRTVAPAIAEPLDEPAVRELLDRDTVLLEFLLGERVSYLWLVSSESTSLHALPGRSALRGKVETFRRLAEGSHWRAAKAAFARAARDLSEALLAPVARRLEGKRLVIVPDGFLAAIPFGALSHPMADDPDAPLVASFEVVVLPSASSLAYLRGLSGIRRSPVSRAAILADPVFDRRDPRLAATPQGGEAREDASSPPLVETRSAARRAGLLTFGRLPRTREEAVEMRAHLAAGDLTEALDFSAAKEVFFDRDLANHSILHFATHAFLDEQRPDLSGIVLSLVDEKGGNVDGVLRLHEIYGLDLACDLVVLSACQTALGRDVEGEGLLGLTRGFLYAGVPMVVATLWQVGDGASAELMRRFYRTLAQPGASPSQALRMAQLSMAEDPEWSAPCFWAGFVFQGDWQRHLKVRFKTK